MHFDVGALRTSFNQMKPIIDTLIDSFFRNLMVESPEMKDMLGSSNMDNLRHSFIKSMLFIVDNVDNPERVIPYLEGLGQRHHHYGVVDHHYPWFGSVLLKTFAQFFQKQWTEDLNDQWLMAFTFIADTMKTGAGKAAAEQEEVAAPAPAPEPVQEMVQNPEPEPEAVIEPVHAPAPEPAKVIPIQKDAAPVQDDAYTVSIPDTVKQQIRQSAKAYVRSVFQQEFDEALEEELAVVIKESEEWLVKKAM